MPEYLHFQVEYAGLARPDYCLWDALVLHGDDANQGLFASGINLHKEYFCLISTIAFIIFFQKGLICLYDVLRLEVVVFRRHLGMQKIVFLRLG